MQNLDNIDILVDYREANSEIPGLLELHGAQIKLCHLKTGDYIINGELILERKTKNDFAMSIIQGRLFKQCANMQKCNYRPLLLIEGNPYNTRHDINKQAIKGVLVSMAACWHIPVVFSSNPLDTAKTIIMTGQQLLKEKQFYTYRNPKPKAPHKQALFFLQGIPNIGPSIANDLLKKFGNLENVILATEDELLQVKGLGKGKVLKMRKFLGQDFKQKV